MDKKLDVGSSTVKDSDDFGSGARIKKFGPCNVRAELEGLWDHAPKEVVGQDLGRLLTNNYCKEDTGKAKTDDIVDDIINGSPPFANVSTPRRIL